MLKLTKKSYSVKTDGRTNLNYRKASLLKIYLSFQVTLEDIRQTGAKAVSSALYHKPAGSFFKNKSLFSLKVPIKH